MLDALQRNEDKSYRTRFQHLVRMQCATRRYDASEPMPAAYIENCTYDEIQVGDSATLTRTLRPEDIQLFAVMSGDVNRAHVDPA